LQQYNVLRHLLKRSIRSHQAGSQRFEYLLVVIIKQTKLKKHQRIEQTSSSKAFGRRCRSVIGRKCAKNHFVCSFFAFELSQACHCESVVENDKPQMKKANLLIARAYKKGVQEVSYPGPVVTGTRENESTHAKFLCNQVQSQFPE